MSVATVIACDECSTCRVFSGLLSRRELYKRSGMFEHVSGGALCPACATAQREEDTQVESPAFEAIPSSERTLVGLPVRGGR